MKVGIPSRAFSATESRDDERVTVRLPFMRCIALAAVALSAASCSSAADAPLYTAQELADAPAFQRDIIADGEVTWAEYESAVIAQRDCLVAAGYQPGEIVRQGSRLDFVTDVDYTGLADPEAANAAFEETFVDCEREYADMVGTMWAEGLVVDDADERERLVQGLIACLANGGLDVDPAATLDDVVVLLSDATLEMTPAISSCLTEHDRLFYVSIQEMN